MAATGFSLSDALNAIGVARVFIGDPFTAGGLTSLPTEGEIRVGVSQTLNRLTAPEHTGEVAHDAWVVPGQVSITVPVIYGDATLFSTLFFSSWWPFAVVGALLVLQKKVMQLFIGAARA